MNSNYTQRFLKSILNKRRKKRKKEKEKKKADHKSLLFAVL